jgi:acetyl esterase/lipase
MDLVLAIPRAFHRLFRPTIEGLFTWNLPWHYRWRLLALQPIALITYSISNAPWLFRRKPWHVEYLRVAPGRTIRALVFKTAGEGSGRKLRPLHIDIHGGGFIGGQPEDDVQFCARLAEETGAVVVSITYRFAPVYSFPTAIDDVDLAVRYLQMHAEERYGADPTLMTTSGFSSGGNLALAASQAANCRLPAPTNIKASTIFCAVINLQLKPQEKPVPPNFPTKDPLKWLFPLYDCYAAAARTEHMNDPRMSPFVASVDSLPENIWVGVAGIDILVHEQLTFLERVKAELDMDEKHKGRRAEVLYDEKGFHGYLNRELFLLVIP